MGRGGWTFVRLHIGECSLRCRCWFDTPADRRRMDGWTDVQGATADGEGGERKQSVMRAGAGERVRFKGNLFLALRHFEAMRMKRKTREGRIIYYRECYISGTHLSLVWQHYPRILQQHILGGGVGIALWCSMKMDEGANGWLGARK